jgi:glucose/arabinose dehydrogenase
MAARAGQSFADRVAFPRRWSYGHRNVLGLKFDAQGRLWISNTARPVATN